MKKHYYFIGIGGIGMSALARYFKFKGHEVSGYDRTPSELTAHLEEEGIAVHYEDRPELLPSDMEHTTVVYTPAVPASLGELQKARNEGYKLLKRSQMLGELTAGQKCLAVAGTHGKTTTSTLTAHILTDSGKGCSAFLGGISLNYGTNMLMSHAEEVVTEADEYDRSFLQLHPAIAVISAMDADHLDIYGDVETMRDAYRQFASQVSGVLIHKYGLPLSENVTKAKIHTYALDDARADFHAENIRPIGDGHYLFDLKYPRGTVKDIRTGVLGKLNIENAVAAAAICLCNGLDEESVRKGIASFKGVHRRMEEHLNTPAHTYIDDYAHHPAELEASIRSLREMFPTRRLSVIFQPHLYTRTRDFAAQFAAALSLCDDVILSDIYPARELPIPGVSSEMILDKVTAPHKELVPYKDICKRVEDLKDELEVLVTFGAGDIEKLTGPITEILR